MPGFLADALSRPENSDIALAVETALTWGMTPMAILLPPHQRAKYSDLDENAIYNSDLALMRAWVILQRETCKKCGTPYWLGHNTDTYIQFKADTIKCHACAEVEKHDKDKIDRENGSTTYPKLAMLFDKPRPTRAMWLKGERTQD